MYAQCPECLTVFSFDADTVAQAHGTVGCGKCGATFDTLATLCETLPDQAYETLSVHPTSPAPPVLMMSVVRKPEDDEVAQAPLFAHAPADADIDNGEAAEAMPSFARLQRLQRGPRRTLRWTVACLALALVLGTQLAWANRRTLAADPDTGPLLRQTCTWLGCTLPPVADLDKLELVSRDVRPHPSVSGALIISATVRNNARFTQPYPVVALTLSDLDGNRIAMRRFRPDDYLDDPAARASGLAPGATAALVFEVQDPGKKAVAFQFGFQ